MEKMNEVLLNMNSGLACLKARIRAKLSEKGGQFAMDNAVAFVIIVAVGAVALTLLINYLQGDLSSNLKSHINDFFS